MNNRQVAHIWAQQRCERGSGSHFYFTGATVYSYGPHFPIARFVRNKLDERAVLFTTGDYSVSTTRHKTYARIALHGLGVPVFFVPHVEGERAHDNFASYKARIAEATERAIRARANAEWRIEAAENLVREANAFAEFFGIRARIKLPEFSPEFISAARARAARKQAAERAKNARRAEREAAEWLNHERATAAYLPKTLLRVSLDGAEIETSRGARFPADDARRAFHIVAACRENGTGWKPAADAPGLYRAARLGHFRISEVEPNGNVRAGCHYVEWAAIEHCARALGLVGAQPQKEVA